MSHSTPTQVNTAPWNNRRRIGPKPPLKLREIWAIRIRLQLAKRTRDLALFNLAIDSKLRGCDLVRLRVGDIAHSGCVVARATVVQQKTKQPVRFELTEQTRDASEAWIAQARLGPGEHLFPSRMTRSPHLSTRQYARIVKGWVALIGLEPADHGTHSLRRTKATLTLPQDEKPAGGAGEDCRVSFNLLVHSLGNCLFKGFIEQPILSGETRFFDNIVLHEADVHSRDMNCG